MFSRLVLIAILVVFASATINAAQPSPPIFDVTQYGAVGDGATDDTIAIQKAVSAMMQSPEGGILSFPAGTFLMLAPSSTVRAYIFIEPSELNRNSSFSVVGAGAIAGSQTSIVYNGTISCIAFSDVQGGTISGIALLARGIESQIQSSSIFLQNVTAFEMNDVEITVYLPSSQPAGVIGMTIWYSHTILIRDTIFNNVLCGVEAIFTNDVLFENVLLFGMRNPPSGSLETIGVFFSFADNIRFAHTRFQNFTFGARFWISTPSGRGVSFADTVFSDISNVGVVINTGGMVSFSNVGFNVTTNGTTGATPTAIGIVADGDHELTLSVSNVAFISQMIGILQNSGSAYITSTLFDSCNIGFFSNITNSTTTSPSVFELTQSVFEGNIDAAVYVVDSGNSVLADNNCLSGSVEMKFVSSSGCVIANNTNCQIEPGTIKDIPAIRAKKILLE